MTGLPEELARDEALLDALGARRPVDDPLGALLSAWAASCDEPHTVVIPISRARRRRRSAVIGLFSLAVAVTGGSAAAAKDPTIPVLGALFGGLFDHSADTASAAMGSGASSHLGAGEDSGVGGHGGAKATSAADATAMPMVSFPLVGGQTLAVLDLPAWAMTSSSTTSWETTSTAQPTSTRTPGGGRSTSAGPSSTSSPGSGRSTRPVPSATTPTHSPTSRSTPTSRATPTRGGSRTAASSNRGR